MVTIRPLPHYPLGNSPWQITIQEEAGLVGPPNWSGGQRTPWSWVLLEMPPVAQLLKNVPTIYGTGRFITVYLFWARWIQTIPLHPIPLRSILILSSQLRRKFLYWSLSFWFSHQSSMHYASPDSCYMPCSIHHPWLAQSYHISRRVQVTRLLVM
jgi:hypothetical protein